MAEWDAAAVILVIGAFATAVGSIVASISAAFAANRAERGSTGNRVELEKIGEKTDQIERHVNSTATAAVAKIEAMQKEIDAMRQLMADQKEVAALLAQAQSNRDATKAAVNERDEST